MQHGIALLLFVMINLTGCNQTFQAENKNMRKSDMLNTVYNNRIEFATMRPPGSRFAMLERRVVITAPPELVELSASNDIQILDELVNLLQQQDRAWAALVLLSAMTQREEKIVDSFATDPDDWWQSLGQDAYGRWHKWLEANRDKLAWDPDKRIFIETK